MNNVQATETKKFYLVSTDILQGISIFIMVIGHTCIWWDGTLDEQYPNLPILPFILLLIAFLVPPGFLFWYTFNSVNSLLRKKDKNEAVEVRSRLLKRAVIFFIIAEFSELVTGFANAPDRILNHLLTWQLFHMFAFTTIFLLGIFEFGCWLESQYSYDRRHVFIALFLCTLVLILSIFLIFHDYSQSTRMSLSVDLNLQSILKRILFDDGQTPIIPFIIFPAAGGLLASYLNLPNSDIHEIKKKAPFALMSGFLMILVGFVFLTQEIYISTPVSYPASSSFVLICTGIHVASITGLVLLMDLHTLYTRERVNKILILPVILSKITLTVYLFHNLPYAIPSDIPILQSVIPTLNHALLYGFLYSLLFVVIALFWQRYKFRYSLEWIIWRLQKAQWRWWIE